MTINGLKEDMAHISKQTIRSSAAPFVAGPSRAFFSRRLYILLLSLCTVCLVIFSKFNRLSLSSTRDSSAHDDRTGFVSKEMKSRHTCKVRRGRVEDIQTDFLWQFCPGNTTTETIVPKSILFLAHGCHHRMTDWWSPTGNDACPDCLGLPEERAIVKAGLDRHFLVVAVSSLRTCWSVVDGKRVAQVLVRLQKQWSNKQRYVHPPILAFGASSGGHFVSSILPRALQEQGTQMEGFISQIMATPIDNGGNDSGNAGLPKAVGYIVMSRDTRTDQQARQRVQEWQALGVPVQYQQVKPLAIHRDFFASHIPEMGRSLSWKLVQALRDAGLLDAEGYLTQNPRSSDWRSVLEWALSRSGGHYKETLVNDQSPLSEVMNVAWGEHEMTREGVEEALDYLLQRI